MELAYATNEYRIGKTVIDFKKETIVMGILNVTPDSFSDGGKYNHVDAAVEHALEMIAQGAKMIDIGGESTRPGHAPVSLEEELERTIPVIRALAQKTDCLISIDTYKAVVAEAAIQAGAHIINDVWGAKREPDIAKVAAAYNVPIILMHNRDNTDYVKPFMEEVLIDLENSIEIARVAGVPSEHIWLDPGVGLGFAKNTVQNLEVMQGLQQIANLGYPVLLGTSRKSVIGNVTGLPVEERLEGTIATICHGIERGAHIVRVHDVQEVAKTVQMLDVLVGKRIIKE